jgi:ubiquinone/menaquinone biosynthesis C-methylase UbiE
MYIKRIRRKIVDTTLLAYNNSAPAYDKKFSTYTVYKEKIRDFAEMLSPGSKVLDLGCGSGINAELMQNTGHSITGFDLSESMLDLARKRCPKQTFIQGSVNSIEDSLKKNNLNIPFDALCLSFIIVHLNDDECNVLLNKLRPLIKSNGLLYLSFMPLNDGKTPGYEKTSFSEDEIYFHYHDSDNLVRTLEKKGFRLESRIIEDYKEKDGSVTADLFLIFRSTGEEA